MYCCCGTLLFIELLMVMFVAVVVVSALLLWSSALQRALPYQEPQKIYNYYDCNSKDLDCI